MPNNNPERPPAEAGNRGAKPLSRRSSKLFVTAAILFAVLFAAFAVYMVARTANDPDIQQGMEEYRRDTGQEPAAADSIDP